MQIQPSAFILSMLLGGTVSIADAQTLTTNKTVERKISRATSIDPAMHVDPALHRANGAVVQNALTYKPVNGGSAFQLICRAGPGLRVSLQPESPNIASGFSGQPFNNAPLIIIDFNHSTQSPDHSGRILQPGQCSPADFALHNRDPTQIRQEVLGDGTVPGFDSLPAERQRKADLKAQNQIDLRPMSLPTQEYLEYLKDPKNFWSFTVRDAGNGSFIGGGSYWRPEFFKPPSPAENYGHMHVTQVKLGAINAGAASQAGIFTQPAAAPAATPPVQGPVPPPPPIAAMPADPPMKGKIFSPPVFDDGAQLWACVDTADGQENGAACIGNASAAAFCRRQGLSGALQVRADGTPNLIVAAAQPGIAIRASNGDVCTADDCAAISELHCGP